MLVIQCDWLALPGGQLQEGPFRVCVEGEAITAVQRDTSPGQESDHHHTHLLTPGFIDLHTHGVGGGEDVMDFWKNPEYSQQVFPSQGTTSFLATVIFPRHHPEKVSAALAALSAAVGKVTGRGAVIEGVHAEGPIINDLGAMPDTDQNVLSQGPIINDLGAMPDADQNMSLTDFEHLLDSIPRLKVMTISPHVEAGVEYRRLKALLKRGVVPALGHDRVATEAEILGALACARETGRRMHVTHLFNVCSFHHRLPSLVNFGLCEQFPDLPRYTGLSPPTVELVGDMAHVHPMVVATVLKARDCKDIIFVSDSILEPKPGATVNYLDRKIQVSEDCKTLSLVGQNVLAGSCCTLLDTFHSLVRVLNVPIGQAVCMLAENPARIAGLSHTGSVEVGKRADLLLFDKDLNLQQTLVAGQVTYTRNSS